MAHALSAGRGLEHASNCVPRGMTVGRCEATRSVAQNPAYRPALHFFISAIGRVTLKKLYPNIDAALELFFLLKPHQY